MKYSLDDRDRSASVSPKIWTRNVASHNGGEMIFIRVLSPAISYLCLVHRGVSVNVKLGVLQMTS